MHHRVRVRLRIERLKVFNREGEDKMELFVSLLNLLVKQSMNRLVSNDFLFFPIVEVANKMQFEDFPQPTQDEMGCEMVEPVSHL